MKTLKEAIEDKINVVVQQYEKSWDSKRYGLHPSVALLRDREKKFFSDNRSMQEEGIKRFRGLLSFRQWDDIDDTLSKNNENKDKYKDRYVDDFNNFSEFYQFLKSLVEDVEAYHSVRTKSMDDNKEV